MTKKRGAKKQPYLFEEILTVLKKNPNKVLNYKQIAAELNLLDESSRALIPSVLAELETRDIIESPERGKYKIKKSNKYLIGVVDMTSSGAAYVESEDLPEDIYVSPKNTKHALHGDTVSVYLYPQRGGQKPEGEITEIIKRGKTEFVGTVQMSTRFAFLVPSSNKMLQDIFIPLEGIKGAKDGQKAIARITDWPEKGNNPIGEIIEVLGDPGENETEMHAILAEFGLPYSFPKDVEKVADFIPTKITEEEISRRRDFRDIITFTIDPKDAKDFDDALSIQKLSNGNWEVGVHIADVTHYVKEGSVIDKEAVSRATSVYLVDRVVPMLPEILSNNVCSLRPREDKLCFSAVFELDEKAEVKSEWFGRTIIHSDRRFTYEEAQEIIETKKGDFAEEILLMDKLAKLLREARYKKGSIAFDKEEVKFNLDEKGNPTGVYFKQAKDSNKLIEDFMLLANKRVAEFAGKAKSADKKSGNNTFVYRVHDLPDPEKLKNLSEFVKQFGYKINPNPVTVAQSLNKMLQEASDKPHSNIVETLAIRSMAKAVYSTKNVGHYGLAFPHYTHFTSPIRRYPDMMVHRLLQYYIEVQNGERGSYPPKPNELEDLCKHSSERERLAADAERASTKYKQIQFMEDKLGMIFDGLISGVTEWGLFVEIIENKCEGMVRLKDMMDDTYIFDEKKYRVYGKRKSKVYTLGDRVQIKVKKVDLARKQMDYVMV